MNQWRNNTRKSYSNKQTDDLNHTYIDWASPIIVLCQTATDFLSILVGNSDHLKNLPPYCTIDEN